jgi:hypothetical protein
VQQVIHIEEFCAEIRVGFDKATSEDTQRYFELLAVHGTLVDENDERVIYITCRHGWQQLAPFPISRWQSNHKDNSIVLTARLVIAKLRSGG